MITCPSCNHQNPEGSLQCENCYTPLPATESCPNCGSPVQADATFCGQCGFNLQAENPLPETSIEATIDETAIGSLPDISLEELSPTGIMPEMSVSETESDILPETAMSSPLISPWDEEEEDLTIAQSKPLSDLDSTVAIDPETSIPESIAIEETEIAEPSAENSMPWEAESPDLDTEFDTDAFDLDTDSGLDSTEIEKKVEPELEILEEPEEPEEPEELEETSSSSLEAILRPDLAETSKVSNVVTQLQVQIASLLHLQSNTKIEIPNNLDVVHIGKPNGQIPPDIDVAGFPDSEVVSRIHADIRIEGDAYYLEDVGSSNGTYVNHSPLVKGNRHRLRSGDRIALGKGDLVSFIFQLG